MKEISEVSLYVNTDKSLLVEEAVEEDSDWSAPLSDDGSNTIEDISWISCVDTLSLLHAKLRFSWAEFYIP